MRTREEIQEDILTLIRVDRSTAQNHATISGLSLEILLDLRDQNERIITLLSRVELRQAEMSESEKRMVALQAIADVYNKANNNKPVTRPHGEIPMSESPDAQE